jgi:P4 family phage/plasmid primase-like protien
MSSNMKKHALKYAAGGYRIVPMYPVKEGRCLCSKGKDCGRPGKHPMTKHGVKDATTDRDSVTAWWTDSPNANIGIAPGGNAGILVLDIDPRNDGKKTLKRLKKEVGPLPDTVTALTGGGGRHLVFQHPSFRIRKDNTGKIFGSGIDVLSDGCIMIAPPSRHATGKRYRWAQGKSYRDLKPASLPETWLNQLRGGAPPAAKADSTPKAQSDGLVTEGGRNNYLTGLAGTLQRAGASPETLRAAVEAENRAKCSPPLDAGEVKKIIRSMSRYRDVPKGADAAEHLMRLALERHFAGGKHLMLSTDNRFWLYDKGVWRVVPDQWVARKVLRVIEANPLKNQKSASLLDQVLKLVKAKLAVKEDVLSFVEDPPPVINCANGEVWIGPDGTVKLRPHRPQSHLRHCLDVVYDPEAECPKYDKALLEIFAKADKPKAMVRHWNELVGYLIQPKRNIPVIVIMFGGGDNGKTVLIRTVTRLLGRELVHAQRVEDLDKSRFAMGSLFGKYLFVDDDVRAGARLPDGILKTISEAKEVTGEVKFKDSFNFVVRTVPVLLCNNIPSVADLSHGMRRRLMVIPFDRTFTDEEKDPDLFDRIWKKELPGVLNQALAGYRRLLKRGIKFNRPTDVEQATTRWLQQANPLPAFLQAQCVKDSQGRCLMKDFYHAYSTWTKDMGYTLTQTQQTVTRNLEHLGFATTRANRGVTILGLVLANHKED